MQRGVVIGAGVAVLALALAWAISPSPVVDGPATTPSTPPPPVPEAARTPGFAAANGPTVEGRNVCKAKRVSGLASRVGEVLGDPKAVHTSHGVVGLRDTWVIPEGLLLGDVPVGVRYTFTQRGRDVVGYRLMQIDPDGIGAALGLRAGDVLGEVNGVVLDGPSQERVALQAVVHDRAGCAALWRDGRWRARYWLAN